MRTSSHMIAVTGFEEQVGHHWGGGPYTALACELGYFRPLHQRGAVGVLLPSAASSVTAILERVDGLLLTGGADIHPARYREWSGPYEHPIDPQRDEFEIELVHEAMRLRLPILGVCRGAQLLNVALGGALHLHLPSHSMHEAGAEPGHHVRIAPDSRLREAIGSDSIWVNSMHHQAVAEPGAGLRVVAWSDDGTPEAVEHELAPVMGIQWHPEKLADPRNYEALVDWLLDSAAAARELPRTLETSGDGHAAASNRREADR